MDDPKTVKMGGDAGPGGAGAPGGPGGRTGTGGQDETQYMPGQAMPPRGPQGARSSGQPAPAAPRGPGAPAGPAPFWQPLQPPAPAPSPGGAATVFLGPQVEPAFAWLVMVSGPGAATTRGQALALRKVGVSTIGRAPDGDIVVADSACSGQHARVRLETVEGGNELFVIYDLGSSNGLYVGDREHYKEDASRKYRHVLQDGDYLLIGETTLVFKQV